MPKNNCLEKALGMVVRNLPWVPGQRRVALPSRRFPNFHAVVVAATGHVFTIRAETNTVDRPVKRSIVSTHHTFETSRSKRQRSRTRSARSASIRIVQLRHPRSLQSCHRWR
jgi:hypothetical protein